MTSSTFDETRTRVIAAAAGLFAENGYHGTGVAQLCAAVGLGKGALYRYIGSKEELLYEISIEQVRSMNAVAERIVDSDVPATDMLRQLARALLRNIAEHRNEWAVFFADNHALEGPRRDRVIAARQQYEGYWQLAMRLGRDQGALAPRSPLVVKGVLGMLNYTYLWFEPTGELTPEQLADVFIATILDGIRPRLSE